MHIVTKSTFRSIRSLSVDEKQAVINHFGNGNASSYHQKIACEVASFTKASDAWINCDCTPETSPAYLFPRQTESGTITLVRPRPPRQNAHHPSCPFYLIDLEKPSEPEKNNQTNLINDFCLLKQEKVSNTSDAVPQDRKSVPTTQLPRLTRILLNILNDAGITTLDNNYPFSDPYRAIYLAGAKISMWPGSSIKFSDASSASPSIAYYYRLLNRLKSEKRFGKQKRKQGYYISLAKEFSQQAVTLNCGSVIDVVGKIAAPTRVPKGPYWVIFLIAETREGSNYFDAVRASIWPAYSEKLPFVVDSDPERETLKQLISWRLYWKDRGIDFIINKPTDFSTPIKPDFVVEDSETGAKVVIETMGSKDEDYLSRKEVTHIEMAKIGKVIEHSPGDDSLTFKKAITAAIFR